MPVPTPLRSLVRSVVWVGNRPLGTLRLRRAISRARPPLKIELGGYGRRGDWIITNVNALTRNYLDATEPWPFQDGSAQIVYADNVIEHVSLVQGRALLSEAYRTLLPGGTLRLVTPDIKAHVERYLDEVDPGTDEHAAEYRTSGCSTDHPVDWLRIPFVHWGHDRGYLYDFATLRRELEGSGFVDVKRLDIGESEHPDLSGLEWRSSDGPLQMVVEATR